MSTIIGSNNTSVISRTNNVLRNTYALLATTMIPTVIGAFIGMSLNFSFFAASPIISGLAMLAISFGMLYLIGATKNSPISIVLLYVFTLFLGVMLGPILQYALNISNGMEIIALAGGSTGLIFLTLAGIATYSKRDFSFLGKFLTIGLILLIVASVVNLFLQLPVFSLVLSSIAIFIFSGFILYDVNRIVNGGETNYVMATLSIYMSLYNLFVNLLHLLLMILGNRD